MADIPTAVPDLPQQFPMPPTQGVAHFALSATATEVLVTLGQSRVMMTLNEGVPTPAAGVEWVVTLSMSPGNALVLAKSLTSVLETIEKTFGKITVDPAHDTKVSVAGPKK